ncbi:MAG: biotin transporter BioY [Oscillospiraceae bacterium]|nr:biotin transporter BioY [Oscillospiraceae bacterium]
MKNFTVRDMTLCAIFTAIIAVCSQIYIPLAVPFTMQTFAIFCSLAILGGKMGTISITLYVILGTVGIPVFAEFTGGFGIVLGTTGGYIIGFIPMALVYWAAEKFLGKSLPVVIASMAAGLLVLYAFGTFWFMWVYTKTTEAVDFLTALKWCVLPFIIPDAVKAALAIFVAGRVSKYVRTERQPA